MAAREYLGWVALNEVEGHEKERARMAAEDGN